MALILYKAVDHGEYGERRGKTRRWVKWWVYPQGDRDLRYRPLLVSVFSVLSVADCIFQVDSIPKRFHVKPQGKPTVAVFPGDGLLPPRVG